jgi:hypothetical protein
MLLVLSTTSNICFFSFSHSHALNPLLFFPVPLHLGWPTGPSRGKIKFNFKQINSFFSQANSAPNSNAILMLDVVAVRPRKSRVKMAKYDSD